MEGYFNVLNPPDGLGFENIILPVVIMDALHIGAGDLLHIRVKDNQMYAKTVVQTDVVRVQMMEIWEAVNFLPDCEKKNNMFKKLEELQKIMDS